MNVVISGGSRGIGLEIARQYPGNNVYGLARGPADEAGLYKEFISQDARTFSAEQFSGLKDAPIDRLFLAHAVFGPRPARPFDITDSELDDLFRINCASQLRVLQQCLPGLQRAEAAKVILLMSKGGMQKTMKGTGAIGYRVTKAAQLALGLTLIEPLQAIGIGFFIVNPGSVRTRIGGKNARMESSESAAEIVRNVEKLGFDDAGKVLNWDGTPIGL